jgi:hypothetical protein
MNNGLHEVIFAAIQGAGLEDGVGIPRRNVAPLRAVEIKRSEAMRTESAANASDEMAFGPVMHQWYRAPVATRANGNRNGGNTNDEGLGVTGRRPVGPLLGDSAIKSASEKRETYAAADTTAPSRERVGIIATPSSVSGESMVASLSMDAPLKAAATGAPRTYARAPASENHLLRPGGLRLAFSLCGFHDALMERLRQGEKLTESEDFLVRMAREDFAAMRPFVINMTLDRLNALVNAPDLTDEAETSGANGLGAMEAFALATLRSLSHRACQLLEKDGPDAALSLFGECSGVQEPLAVFQQVFTTALDLVEVFERLIPGEAKLLARLAEALDSEVEKI